MAYRRNTNHHSSYRGAGHLYRNGAKGPMERSFEHRYGKEKGKYVFGAEVGMQYRRTHKGKNWNQK